MKLVYERDGYGTKARASLVADFMEACAWKYGRYQFDDMEGFIRSWGRVRARDPFVEPDSIDDPGEDGPDEAATDRDPAPPSDASHELGEPSDEMQRHVVGVLHERRDALGARYPFRVDDIAITRPKGPPFGAYDSLLAITLAHTFNIIAAPTIREKVEVLFERVAARCLYRPTWRVHNLGDAGRHSSDFGGALEAASRALGWGLHDATVRKRAAQEEGCDTIVMMPWYDSRPGRLFMVGQSAVTASDEWLKKIMEPSPNGWAPRLQRGGAPRPIPFLSVSHHVEALHLKYLQEQANGIVIDRLRLVCGPRADELTPDERSVIDAVHAADVEV